VSDPGGSGDGDVDPDSTHGVAAAAAAGMTPLGFAHEGTPDLPRAETVVTAPDELRAALLARLEP